MNKILKTVASSVTVIFSMNFLVYAETSSSLQEQINDNNSKIESLEDERDNIQSEIDKESNELNGIIMEISGVSDDLNKVQEEVKAYQEKIDTLQSEIDSINNEIITTEAKISEIENTISEKEEEAISLKNIVDKRIRTYYKIDIMLNYIYLLITSDSILSFSNNIQGIFKIINFDKKLITEAKDIQAQLKIEKEELATALGVIEENKNTLVSKQDELKEIKNEYIAKEEYHRSKINELSTLEDEKNSIIAALNNKEVDIENEIGDLIAYNQELQKEIDNIFASINNGNSSNLEINPEENDKPSLDNSYGEIGNPSKETFLRPGKGVVTDSYGPRINPVTGAAGFHTGVDFADNYGDPVYASKSGSVVYSGWISGYGNTIILDHGEGIQTLYAHNREMVVSVGEIVYRGQTIARVGSTGMSTGPHIHWEIRINGQHVDPMLYL